MGTNQFLSFPVISVGAEGPQPEIDLFTLVPPTGLDSDLTLLGVGNFIGTISIEGSPSAENEDWSVIAQFESGLDADANVGPLLGFAPIVAENVVVRRLRLNVRGRIIQPVNITVGAEQNCDCISGVTGPAGPTGPQGPTGPAGPAATGGSQNFFVNGQAATDQVSMPSGMLVFDSPMAAIAGVGTISIYDTNIGSPASESAELVTNMNANLFNAFHICLKGNARIEGPINAHDAEKVLLQIKITTGPSGPPPYNPSWVGFRFASPSSLVGVKYSEVASTFALSSQLGTFIYLDTIWVQSVLKFDVINLRGPYIPGT